MWGAEWGAPDEAGPLRSVLVRRPGGGLARMRADAWDEDAQALVDPDGRWYWTDRTPPDLDRVRRAAPRARSRARGEGVEVVVAEPLGRALHEGRSTSATRS